MIKPALPMLLRFALQSLWRRRLQHLLVFITLTTAFFNEVNNGARVTLTFHFWSGTKVTYHITKSGSSVTGTA